MVVHKGTVTLETERLILRRFKVSDAPAMYKNWASDSEVTQYLQWQPHVSAEATGELLDQWAESYKEDDYYQWAIVLKELGEPVGGISVVSHDDNVGKAHIGYCIGRKWWHRGITSEALSAVIDFLFDEVGMQRIEARHDVRNPNSGGVMKKCGMKYEGTMRRSDITNSGMSDASWYAIFADER